LPIFFTPQSNLFIVRCVTNNCRLSVFGYPLSAFGYPLLALGRGYRLFATSLFRHITLIQTLESADWTLALALLWGCQRL
jgi:hypothetical protein